jgi:2,3-bisphosphoglycerate-independent phosphoglycerate mutase
MRCIFVILDGIGDRGHECFSGKTPLYAANTPNLDYLSNIGMNGLYHTTLQGIPMSSEEAHFIMFGYDLEDFPGRGFIEAIGEGIEIGEKDVAILCHLCSVEKENDNLTLKWGFPELDEQDAIVLIDNIKYYKYNGVRIKLIHSKNTKGFLLLKGDVSEKITDSDPIYEGRSLIKIQPIYDKKISKSSIKTANALNNYLLWCYNKLKNHPINIERTKNSLIPVNALVTQRPGKYKKIPPFEKKWGMKGLSISSGSIYWGLCKMLGMDIIKVRDTGDVEKDLIERLKIAKEAEEFDFIHVHTKTPDEAGHKKNPYYKKEVIEAIDRAMLYVVNEIINDKEILLIITADHSTASSGSLIHTGETVPITMVGKYIRKDDVKQFNEISCSSGSLGIIKGKELMHLTLNFLDKAKLHGLMDSPFDYPYHTSNPESLKL